MEHQFNTELAERYGVIPAIILHNFVFWIIKNEANGRHFHNGKYWTYNSISAMQELFSYLSAKQIRSAIDSLVDSGVMFKDNFNSSAYDRTLWYSIDESVLCIYRKNKFHLPKRENEFAPEGEPIPDSKPDSKPNNPINSENENFDFLKTEKEKKGENFAPPDSVVVFDAEKEVLANRILFEKICMSTSKSEEVARDSLHLYHLWLEDNEKYPKTRKSIFAGFEKWLLNEKKFNYGNDTKKTNGNTQSSKLGPKSGGFAILTEALEQLKSGGFSDH